MGFSSDWGSTGLASVGLGTSVDGFFSGETASTISWTKVFAIIIIALANATNTLADIYTSPHT